MDLRVEVTRADLRREADFLECHRALPALGLLVPLRELVLVLPKSRNLTTGGEAIGATSTRSYPRSCAIARAWGVGMRPSWAPSSSTTRTCGIRIIWLMRRSLAMADPFELGTAHFATETRARSGPGAVAGGG